MREEGNMADKLMIVMVNTDPRDPAELGAPFFQATVAAAMEYEVEVVLTGRAGELAVKGVAEKLHVKEGSPKSVYDFMKDAHEAGVKFKVCTPTLELWGEDLIPEIEETVGGAYVISQAMDDDVVTFTY
jgi:predicted peroxiredoxin